MCKIDIREASIHFSKLKNKKKRNHINNLETYLVSLYKLNQKSQFHKSEMTRVESEIELLYNEKVTGVQIRSRLDYIEVGEKNLNISSI